MLHRSRTSFDVEKNLATSTHFSLTPSWLLLCSSQPADPTHTPIHIATVPLWTPLLCAPPSAQAIFGGTKPQLAREQHGVPDSQRKGVWITAETFRATGAAWVPPAAVAADGEAGVASGGDPTRLEDCTSCREGHKLAGTMVANKLATARSCRHPRQASPQGHQDVRPHRDQHRGEEPRGLAGEARQEGRLPGVVRRPHVPVGRMEKNGVET